MRACLTGHKDVVQLLLEHSERIDLNARDNDGRTALMFAVQNGHPNVVKSLVNHSDIDLNVTDNYGRTALMIGSQDIINFLEQNISSCVIL